MSTYQTYNSGNEIIKMLWITNQNKLKKDIKKQPGSTWVSSPNLRSKS
jgi:hypothetical protein